jgi:hypothetical protein
MTIPQQIRNRKTPLSVKNLADELGISVYSVYKLIKKGLPAMHLGTILLDPSTTADWLESRTTSKRKQN